MLFFCFREKSEFGSYIGSSVPVPCPSDNCGSSPKKVNIKIIHSMYNETTLHPYKCSCNLKCLLPSHITLPITCTSIFLFFFRQTRKTTESSEAVTTMSRSIFYMINNTDDSTVSTQNEYEKLRISSLHVYSDLSMKLIPAPTSYINLSSLK